MKYFINKTIYVMLQRNELERFQSNRNGLGTTPEKHPIFKYREITTMRQIVPYEFNMDMVCLEHFSDDGWCSHRR